MSTTSPAGNFSDLPVELLELILSFVDFRTLLALDKSKVWATGIDVRQYLTLKAAQALGPEFQREYEDVFPYKNLSVDGRVSIKRLMQLPAFDEVFDSGDSEQVLQFLRTGVTNTLSLWHTTDTSKCARSHIYEKAIPLINNPNIDLFGVSNGYQAPLLMTFFERCFIDGRQPFDMDNFLAIAKELVSKGVDPDGVNSLGMTYMHLVARYQLTSEVVSDLVELSGNINSQSTIVACSDHSWNYFSIVASYTPLHLACRESTIRTNGTGTIMELLDHGANPLLEDSKGLTPLAMMKRLYDKEREEDCRTIIDKMESVATCLLFSELPLDEVISNTDGGLIGDVALSSEVLYAN